MKQSGQMSESIRLGIILALAGGFMDAYSYVCRGGVFANAQTGNMLLFGIRLAEKNMHQALDYLFPVLAFAAGIALAETIRIRSKDKSLLHWRQFCVLLEAAVLFGVSFLSQEMNLPANSITSFACGIQVESFRKIRGNGIATTMCIGNLRSATQHMCGYLHTKDKDLAVKGLLYYGIIVCFVVGAVIGNACVKHLGERAIVVCSVILLAAFLMMFIDEERGRADGTDNGKIGEKVQR